MEAIKNFFTLENMRSLFETIYTWLEDLLIRVFGNLGYEPLRNLLTNPWFWIIILALILLSIIFRRR
jgi:hypothetical protein